MTSNISSSFLDDFLSDTEPDPDFIETTKGSDLDSTVNAALSGTTFDPANQGPQQVFLEMPNLSVQPGAVVPQNLHISLTDNLSDEGDEDEDEGFGLFFKNKNFFLSDDEFEKKYGEPIPTGRNKIKGLKQDHWSLMIDAAVSLREQSRKINLATLRKMVPTVPFRVVEAAIGTPAFSRALQKRGVTPEYAGLSSKQLLALSVLTDFSSKSTLKTKLAKVGVAEWEFQAWLGNSIFQNAYRQLSEQLFHKAQAAVNVALTQQAVNGDLGSIKYFNEMSGRYNPAEQSNADVRQVLTMVVEVLNSSIKDPNLLKEISGKLAGVMVAIGGRAPGSYRR